MLSVLVADDETGARTMLAMALRGADIHVDMAADGPTALALIGEKPYDWVVSDVKLPGMDGVTLIKQIGRLSPKTRMLLISAVLHEDDVRALPIDGFWRKPFDPFAIQKFIVENANVAESRKAYGLR